MSLSAKTKVLKFFSSKTFVVGNFRTGTNAMSALLQKHYFVDVINEGERFYWKHLLAPQKPEIYPRGIPFICMTRDPLPWIKSLYKFNLMCHNLSTPQSIQQFIRAPYVVRNKNHPIYNYNNPIEYWNSFYSSYLDVSKLLKQDFYFIKNEDLAEKIEPIAKTISQKYSWRKKFWRGKVKPLPYRVGPKIDSPAKESHQFLLSQDDINHIKSCVNGQVYQALSY